jgi:hypothetical protein
MIDCDEFYDNDDEDHNEAFQILFDLNREADKIPGFKNKFVDSCEKIFKERGYLSDAQIERLKEIYRNM